MLVTISAQKDPRNLEAPDGPRRYTRRSLLCETKDERGRVPVAEISKRKKEKPGGNELNLSIEFPTMKKG